MSKKARMVLYHANCPDGFAAAWAAWCALGDSAAYVPCSYGADPPDVTGAAVYVVDFSFPRDALLAMAAAADSVVVLDHHVTARDALADLDGAAPNLRVQFDMNRSGATMAWDHFNPDEDCWLVRYAEDRDLWRHALPRTKEVNAYLMAMPRSFHCYRRAFELGPGRVAALGEGCLTWLRHYVDATKRSAQTVTFLGHAHVPIVNAPFTAISEVVGELAEGSEAGFAAGWHLGADGTVRYSLRSRGDFDVSALAVRMGGGGHKNAAGFRSRVLPWDFTCREEA